jgi:hypothetical protein
MMYSSISKYSFVQTFSKYKKISTLIVNNEIIINADIIKVILVHLP